MIVQKLLKPFRMKIAFQLFLVVISGLSVLEINSQYCTTELSIQMVVVHLFVLHAGKYLRTGNGNWYSIREHLRHRACRCQIQRPLLALNCRSSALKRSQPNADPACRWKYYRHHLALDKIFGPSRSTSYFNTYSNFSSQFKFRSCCFALSKILMISSK